MSNDKSKKPDGWIWLWLLFGPLTKKDKDGKKLKNQPTYSFYFRLLWFMTSVSLITMGVLLFIANGEISQLNSDLKKYLIYAIATFVTAVVLWIVRARYNKTHKHREKLSEHNEEESEGEEEE